MNRTFLTLLVLSGLCGVAACRGDAGPPAEPDHGDHSHAGEDSGGHSHGPAGPERPTVAVTRWSERTELFLEFPEMVAGETGRSAVHLTSLSDFSPVASGEVSIVLRSGDGRHVESRGGPSRPGIFGVDLRPDRAGTYTMTVYVESPGFEDMHEIGPVTVHPAGAHLEAPAEDDGAISFLKEQQWTLEFGTVPAETRALRSSLAVTGVVEPRPGGDALVAAPVPGTIDLSVRVPSPGTAVRAGEVLARILPRSEELLDAAALRADLVEAEQAHGLSVREVDRVERLVEARALPGRRLDEARAAAASVEARLGAARERWRRHESLAQETPGRSVAATFAVRAPVHGVLSEVRFAPGAIVDANDVLARIVDPDRLNVVAFVPEANASAAASVEAGEVVLEGRPPIPLSRPIAIGRVLDPRTRTVDVRFELDNRAASLPVGRSVTVRLFSGAEEAGTAIPESAIVDDAGSPVAFVQTGGESFERRPLRLGSRDGGFVRILEGVAPGERVVDRGAYLVRLAAMSSQIPAHGHVH